MLAGLAAPVALRPVRRVWMALAIGPFVATTSMRPETERQPFTPDGIAAAYGLD